MAAASTAAAAASAEATPEAAGACATACETGTAPPTPRVAPLASSLPASVCRLGLPGSALGAALALIATESTPSPPASAPPAADLPSLPLPRVPRPRTHRCDWTGPLSEASAPRSPTASARASASTSPPSSAARAAPRLGGAGADETRSTARRGRCIRNTDALLPAASSRPPLPPSHPRAASSACAWHTWTVTTAVSREATAGTGPPAVPGVDTSMCAGPTATIPADASAARRAATVSGADGGDDSASNARSRATTSPHDRRSTCAPCESRRSAETMRRSVEWQDSGRWPSDARPTAPSTGGSSSLPNTRRRRRRV